MKRRNSSLAKCLFTFFALVTFCTASGFADSPNIILVMADDQGWGQTGFRNHPVLKTPNLDAMAENGLRFDRFYAGSPVCSPTRAAVLTGRTPYRCGVPSHGYALRRQEQTIAQILQSKGYETAHFGKWHLDGFRGPGAPILKDDPHHPGHFGFDHWLSVTNFFDRNPILSRKGEFESFQGDSSEVVVEEAIKFLQSRPKDAKPFFVVVWFGSPHSPFEATETDRDDFTQLDPTSAHHYGELVAMDRSVGQLRDAIAELSIKDETLLWFTSDNGGLPKITPGTVGGLRGNKGNLYEGGLRVPSIIEWPNGIPVPRVESEPACAMDIFPTLVEITKTQDSVLPRPRDGVSLVSWFQEKGRRQKEIGFAYQDSYALIDGNLKLLALKKKAKKKTKTKTKTIAAAAYHYQVFDLAKDPNEKHNLLEKTPMTEGALPDFCGDLMPKYLQWRASVTASVNGKDYPGGKVDPVPPEPTFWHKSPSYAPYLEEFRRRPEYGDWIRRFESRESKK